MKKIRIGQIGIGHNHAEAKMLAVRKFPELFEVMGVCETDPEWIEKRGNLKAYDGLPFVSEKYLLENCDAILIETDVWNLTQTALRCVQAGKHIHLDKPANGTYADYKKVLDLAREKRLTVQLGYMYRYNPAIRYCMDAVGRGELGEIFSVNAEMSTCHAQEYRQWLQHFQGGIMYILGSHLIDLIVWMLGAPQKVTSFLKHSGFDGVECCDNNQCILEYEHALARVNVTSVEVNGWGRRQFVVCGSEGTIVIEPIENETAIWRADKAQIGNRIYENIKTDISLSSVPMDCRYDQMVRDFFDYVTGGKENPYTYDHELLVHEVLGSLCGYNEFLK